VKEKDEGHLKINAKEVKDESYFIFADIVSTQDNGLSSCMRVPLH